MLLKATRSVIIIAFLSFLPTICFGQTSDSSKTIKKNSIIGIQAGTSILVDGPKNLNYFACITVSKNRFFLALGPFFARNQAVIHWDESYEYFAARSKQKYILNGFHFFGQIRLSKQEKVFNPFFQYQLIYTINKSNGVATGGTITPWNSNHHFFSDEAYHIQRTVAYNYLGLGFKLNFTKKIYLTKSFNFGFFRKSTVVDFENDQIEKWKEHSYSLNLMLNLGLGFTF